MVRAARGNLKHDAGHSFAKPTAAVI